MIVPKMTTLLNGISIKQLTKKLQNVRSISNLTSLATQEKTLTFPFEHIEGKKPPVVFCHGLGAPWDCPLAMQLRKYVASDRGHGFVRFKYRNFGDPKVLWDIHGWIADLVNVLNYLQSKSSITDKTVIFGVSAGAMIAVKAALMMPEKIESLFLLSPTVGAHAIPYMDTLMPGTGKLIAEGRKIMHPGIPGAPQTLVDKASLDEYSNNCPLNLALAESPEKSIPLKCPVKIVHGLADMLVPHQQVLQFANKLESEEVELVFLKKKGHMVHPVSDLFPVLEKLLQKEK